MAISEQVQQRSDLIGTQVITRNTGKKLGVVNQLWVDIDQREVIALGLRSTLITGDQRYIDLEDIRQIGDVILVDDETAIAEFNALNYSTLINHEVVTEKGDLLGKVRGFKFDTVSGEVSSLIIASIGLPLIPSTLISTYELSVDQIVSTGPDRIIVFEGAEDRLNQMTVGLMERMGLGGAPWENEDDAYIPSRASASNQLSSGLRTSVNGSPRTAAPRADEEWDAAPTSRRAQDARRAPTPDNPWDDEPEEEYQAPPLKLPERQKVAEYEREEY
jgi:sporulation protein YlmC with PRC-barrel domain